ncbi:SMP-30/gluconolactonase/LRE family protein [Uliginosibacterium gangwonense]|uniref:SMP-30/gluconolactonase/LRE family protein n=1 Tax=Uliginosibacterium gangwonense TaxID=392736 RepID=UPI001B7FCA32|nr:SMP-30/gluconolactonase/LRE family protein [Uliginosibacterium gangwonense]
MMMLELLAKPVVQAAVADTLGECVLWDERLQTLRWLDILGKRIWRLGPEDATPAMLSTSTRPACMALTADPQRLLVGFEDGLSFLNTESGEATRLCDVDTDKPYTRLNDGRCDRDGNFLFGTYDEVEQKPRGTWYRYTAAGQLEKLHLPPVAIPNSLCLSLDGRTLYFSDGVARCIQCCDYDARTGQVSNLRVFAPVPEGYPDGSTVDAQGYIWNAEWGSSRVVRYRPDGQIDRVISVPVSQPSCVAFGGAALDTLFITSARVGLSAEHLATQPQAGHLFTVKMNDVKGITESRWG